MASKTLTLIDKYVELFKVFSKDKIEDYNNNILQESDTIKQNISSMVKIGLEMEENIHKINKSAMELRDEAYEMVFYAYALVRFADRLWLWRYCESC